MSGHETSLKLHESPLWFSQGKGKPALDFRSRDDYGYNLFEAAVDVAWEITHETQVSQMWLS